MRDNLRVPTLILEGSHLDTGQQYFGTTFPNRLKILRIIINLSVNFVLALLLWETYLLRILPLFLTKIREILNIFSSFRLCIEDFSFNSNVLYLVKFMFIAGLHQLYAAII